MPIASSTSLATTDSGFRSVRFNHSESRLHVGQALPVLARACALLIFTACAGGCTSPAPSPSTDEVSSVRSEEGPEVPAEPGPSSLAVLPFTQVKGEASGAEVVRRSFYNHLSSRKFRDVELYRVDGILRDKGIASAADLGKASIRELAEFLDVDALLYGEVTGYDRLFLVTYSQVVVGLKVRMIDGRSGEVLWTGEHTSRSHGGGPSLSPIGLAMEAVDAALNMQQVELLRGADDVSRTLVGMLPGPTLSRALAPPGIQALTQNSGGSPKRAGEVIKVVMIGEPGNIAHFSIGAFKQGLPMVEGPEGTYVGSYRVLPGDQADAALIEGTLTDERGNQSRWVDALGAVTLDTRAPATPTGMTVSGRDAAVVVRWESNAEADLAGYRLYRSDSPLTGYGMVQQAEETEARDTGLTNSRRYYYKVAAIDRTGNESPLSSAVGGTPVRPGPTPVAADIADDTTWYAEAGPYVLEHPVTVRPGVTLSIEPGVVVESVGPGLRVRGSLLALGTPHAPIVFRGWQGREEPRPWDGLTFDNTGGRPNRLAHTKIRDARVALKAVFASPAVHETLFIENDLALLVEEGSSPQIEKNTITGNRRDGIVSRNATPTIVRNEISHNQGNGITLVASLPVVTENNVHSNKGRQLVIEGGGAAIVNVQNNWWGTTDRAQLAELIAGPASYAGILDGPYPEGKLVAIATERPEAPRVATSPQTALATHGTSYNAGPVPDSVEIDALVAAGEVAYEQGRLREALQAFIRALTVRPDDHRLHFRTGLTHYRLGDLSGTLAAMQQAAALLPDHPGYRYHLGLVYSELGMSEQAMSEWRRVLAIDPRHRNARMLLELGQRKASL